MISGEKKTSFSVSNFPADILPSSRSCSRYRNSGIRSAGYVGGSPSSTPIISRQDRTSRNRFKADGSKCVMRWTSEAFSLCNALNLFRSWVELWSVSNAPGSWRRRKPLFDNHIGIHFKCNVILVTRLYLPPIVRFYIYPGTCGMLLRAVACRVALLLRLRVLRSRSCGCHVGRRDSPQSLNCRSPEPLPVALRYLHLLDRDRLRNLTVRQYCRVARRSEYGS
jgi:hypothetical protein